MREYRALVVVVLCALSGCASEPPAALPAGTPAGQVPAPPSEEPSVAVRMPAPLPPAPEKMALPGTEDSGPWHARQAETDTEKYLRAIRAKISNQWKRPANSRYGLNCTARVKVAPGGKVMVATLQRSSGDPTFDRSVLQAVRRASPLPIPAERELYEQFREIEFVFRPDE